MLNFSNLTFKGKPLKKVYFIGIKGSGIVSLVQLLSSQGIEITGSDTQEKFFTDSVLRKLGIRYFESFSPAHIPPDADLIIYSTAYTEKTNVELKYCREKNLPLMSYPEILAGFFNEKYGIAVCGTHGKTTTSALLSVVLQKTGQDPSAAIGGRVIDWGTNALTGKGEYFVIEADEFQNKLKLYNPQAAILTSLDWDHPDCFKDFNTYKKVFKDFISRLPASGILIVWGDNAATLEVAQAAPCPVIKYGFSAKNDVIISSQQFQQFTLSDPKGKILGNFYLQLIGRHNLLNAAAVAALCLKLGLTQEAIARAMESFRGTTRRFEYIGQRNGALLIDDYAHHPEEIKATLKAAREIYPHKNIIAVFHPHSYSRTEALLNDFAQSFDAVNQVIILDIYSSAREFSGKVSSQDLSELINQGPDKKSLYLPTIEEAVDYLKEKIGKNDVVFSLGAGNVFELAEKLKEK